MKAKKVKKSQTKAEKGKKGNIRVDRMSSTSRVNLQQVAPVSKKLWQVTCVKSGQVEDKLRHKLGVPGNSYLMIHVNECTQ
jgi:hypothetical protein